MAALIAMPAVAFVLFMTMVFEDRILPRTDSPQEASPLEADAAGAAIAATVDGFLASSDGEPPAATEEAAPALDDRTRSRHCAVQQDRLPSGRSRTHRPAAGAVPERHATTPRRPAPILELRLEGVLPARSH